MSLRTHLLVAAAAVTAVTAAGATAHAQSQSERREAPRAEREVRVERGERGDRMIRLQREGPNVMIHRGHARKDQAEHLRNILQLRPNQEAALTAYIEAMKPRERTERARVRGEDRPDTTPEKLARMEQRMNARQAEQRARLDAVRRFYGQLDERQKKAFDELPLMMGGPELHDMPRRIMRIMDRIPLEGPHHPHMDRFHGAPLPPPPPAPPAPPRL